MPTRAASRQGILLKLLYKKSVQEESSEIKPQEILGDIDEAQKGSNLYLYSIIHDKETGELLSSEFWRDLSWLESMGGEVKYHQDRDIIQVRTLGRINAEISELHPEVEEIFVGIYPKAVEESYKERLKSSGK